MRDDVKWNELPELTWEQAASWHVATWVLRLFGWVYALCFLVGLVGLYSRHGSFEDAMNFVKFMLTTIMPLVTLAVGFYLGCRHRGESE